MPTDGAKTMAEMVRKVRTQNVERYQITDWKMLTDQLSACVRKYLRPIIQWAESSGKYIEYFVGTRYFMRPLAHSSLCETMRRNLTPTLHNGSHHTTLHYTTWHYTTPHNGMVITCPSGQLRLHIISVDRDWSIHLRPLQPRRRWVGSLSRQEEFGWVRT